MSDKEPEVIVEPANDEGKTSAPSQEKRSEADKAAFSLKKNAERVIELGGDPAQILGVKTHIEVAADDDSKPVTVGMLRDIQKKDAQKTALQMAGEIQDEDTRNAVKEALNTRITPSGNADEDFRFALGAVSAGKNKQVIEEVTRYVAPKRTAAGGSMPAHVEEEFTPTAEEQVFMRPPYNTPLEKIKAARRAVADKR